MRFTRTRSLLLAALFALPAAAPPTRLEAQAAGPLDTAGLRRNARAAQLAVDTMQLRASPSVTRYCGLKPSSQLAYLRTGLCAWYPREIQALRLRVDSLAALLNRPNVPPPPPPPPPPPAPTVASLDIHATSGDPLPVGSTRQLYGDPKSAAGVTLAVPVQWSAGPSSVGTISGTGLLTAVGPGSVTVTARADTVVASRTFTVPAPAPGPDTTVVVKPPPVDTTTPAQPPTGGVAELPRVKPVVPYPSCARTTTLTMVSSLQAALDAASFGDCIALPAGATYTGNFTWKARAGSSGYVTVLTAGIQLPPPGTRMTPSACLRLQCAKILSPRYEPAIATEAGARGLIIRGVELSYTQAAVATTSNVLVRFSDPDAGTAPPSDLVLDRDYIHGLPQLDMRRCVLLNSSNSIVVDSWLDECHSNNSDSQAILGYHGSRGILIQNNTLSGGHEIVMWGGADTPSAAYNPADIWLLGNHIYHPLSWYKVWQVKNCLETKNVDRYVIEGNVIENCWADAQAGFAFVFKSENQSGTAPWSGSHDLTVRLNIVRNVTSGVNLSGTGSNPGPNIVAARFTFTDNIVEGIGDFGGQWPGTSIPLQILGTMTDAQLVRTSFRAGSGTINQAISFDGAPAVRLVFTGNQIPHGQYGVKGSDASDGTTTLAKFAPGGVFTSNQIVGGGSCTQYPAGNQCPATAVPSSSFAGADTARILAATAKVVVLEPAGARQVANPRTLKYPPRSSPSSCTTADWWKVAACVNPQPLRVK